MPNWCDTTYKCVGDKKELKQFLQILENNKKLHSPRVPNGFGTMWLGCIIDNFSLNWREYQCRGEVVDFDYANDILTIYQSTAWCEQEGFREAIKQKFPSLEVYYVEEEPGNGIYETNSFDMFPERYIITYRTGEQTGQEYFETIEKAAEFMSKLLHKDIDATESAIDNAASMFNEKHDDEHYIYINTFIEV